MDYSAKEKVFGKKIGNDFLEGKITLPIILLFQKSNKIERQMLNKFFSQNIRNEDDFKEYITNLIDLLEKPVVPKIDTKCNFCNFTREQILLSGVAG